MIDFFDVDKKPTLEQITVIRVDNNYISIRKVLVLSVYRKSYSGFVATISKENSPKMGREVSTWEVTVNATNTLTHVMVGFVSVYMCYVAYERGYSNISMHVLLCALGVCFPKVPTLKL